MFVLGFAELSLNKVEPTSDLASVTSKALAFSTREATKKH